jgi:hypothetical protein
VVTTVVGLAFVAAGRVPSQGASIDLESSGIESVSVIDK